MTTSDDQARAIIESFAKQLLELNGGTAIPRHWKSMIAKAISPIAGKQGPRIDGRVHSEIIKEIALAGTRVLAPRTKTHNPADAKRDIALRVAASLNLARPPSLRTINRIFTHTGLHAVTRRFGAGEIGSHYTEEDIVRAARVAVAIGLVAVVELAIYADAEELARSALQLAKKVGESQVRPETR